MIRVSLSAPRPTAGRLGLVLLAAALLAGCADSIAGKGFDEAAQTAGAALGRQPVWIRSDEDRAKAQARVAALLQKPLDPDDAVEIALLNNRGLQARYAELGLSAADLAQASRLPNPGFSFKRLSSNGDLDIERQFSLDAMGVLTLPIRHAIEKRRFEQAKLKAANDILVTAANVRQAWYRAVAAQQAAVYVGQVKDAAEARVDLARRMRRTGNWSLLDYAREQAFYAETVARIARAKLSAAAERERLVRLLGLYGGDLAFTLPERLPDLPAALQDTGDLEARALAERLDIRAGRAEVAGLAASLGLTRTTRVINVLETSYYRNSLSGQSRQTGYEIRLEVPLFDWGDAKVAHAEQTYMQAVDRLAEQAVNLRSELRESYGEYQTAWDLARHYRDEIIPLRQKISDEMLLRYNGMLVSAFDLLGDAREQVDSVTEAIAAQRDFWLAETSLRFVTLADTGRPDSAPALSLAARN
ncbi:TolC family protein [Ferrovibrio xuzhouensis]|uniref:TolC family protein n=1 Tax=Ferrovibrio xuzhouensis TaxID=1576914 RepID=A0ABV7VB60_9PROT